MGLMGMMGMMGMMGNLPPKAQPINQTIMVRTKSGYMR